jgi:predicted alpha/beta-hydrolase family hydrolase
MARQQRLQHTTALRRKPLFVRSADRFGVRDGVARAALVIVIGLREYCVRV